MARPKADSLTFRTPSGVFPRTAQDIVESDCPVCSSRDVELVYRVSNVEAARAFLNPARNRDRYEALGHHIAALWGQDYCCIRRCRDCGFGYSDPYVAGDEKFYRLATDHKPGDYPTQKWEYEIAKDLLKSWIAEHGADAARVIEIGAGDGAFVRQIAPELVDPLRVFCTEYDDYALGKIRQLGIRAAQGDIRQIDMSSEKAFNIVFMFEVLEHMDRLPELFAKFRTLTSPHSDLVIAVPNDKRTQFNEGNGGLLDMPPNHIGRWSKSAFEALGSREGWHVVKFLEEPTNAKQSWERFSYYRYARATQFDRSLSARVRGLRPTPLTRSLEIAMMAVFAIRSVPLLPKLFAEGMGGSVLVHLRRRE